MRIYPPPTLPGDIWAHPTRTLTTTQFPFWSAIISLVQSSVSVPNGAWTFIDIQPPAGETWWVSILTRLYTGGSTTGYIRFHRYDGVTRELITGNQVSYNLVGLYWYLPMGVQILTNSMYGSISYYSGLTASGVYGYSGFKLSQPLWAPTRVLSNPERKPWKRGLTVSLPTEIEALTPYGFEAYDDEREIYVPAIMLEEDTVLATDPVTEFPVERLTCFITVEEFLNRLGSIKLDPVGTGFKKYIDKWAEEGIVL